jgi:hypothetical protein
MASPILKSIWAAILELVFGMRALTRESREQKAMIQEVLNILNDEAPPPDPGDDAVTQEAIDKLTKKISESDAGLEAAVEQQQ